MKSIKKNLQSDEWDKMLSENAEQGDEDAILGYMHKWHWLKEQRHLPPKPYNPSVKSFKPKTEV